MVELNAPERLFRAYAHHLVFLYDKKNLYLVFLEDKMTSFSYTDIRFAAIIQQNEYQALRKAIAPFPLRFVP